MFKIDFTGTHILLSNYLSAAINVKYRSRISWMPWNLGIILRVIFAYFVVKTHKCKMCALKKTHTKIVRNRFYPFYKRTNDVIFQFITSPCLWKLYMNINPYLIIKIAKCHMISQSNLSNCLCFVLLHQCLHVNWQIVFSISFIY